jgi:type II secretory pathway component GspD/PulD (secretin)
MAPSEDFVDLAISLAVFARTGFSACSATLLVFRSGERFGQNSWLTGQTLPIIPVMPIVAIAPPRVRTQSDRENRVQSIPNMRSRLSKTRRDTSTVPEPDRMMMTLALVLALCTQALSQTGPQFRTSDQPAAGGAEAKVEAYPLTAATREVLAAWQQRAVGRTDLRVAIDERTSQALVFAPPAVQTQIQQELAAKNTPAQAAAPNKTEAHPGGSPGLIQLTQMPAGDVHQRIEGLLSRQLPATVDALGEWQTFQVDTAPGVGVGINVNLRSRQVRIDGPPAQVAAWRSVVEALDAPPTADKVTRIVNTKSAAHDRVRKALEVLKTDGSGRSSDNTSLLSTIVQPQATTVAAQGAAPAAPAGGAPAANAPAQNPQQPTTTTLTPGGAATAAQAAKLAEASGLLGPVQVEFVEGLDVIVLRGSERDVQRVMEIIKQIEELSAVTVPTVEIYPLKNVDSVRIGALLQRLYEQVLGPRIGTVSITPLGTPNALLLIGRAENVKMAIELIQKLDQPIVPTARFEVFPLKHANATEAKGLIDSFLGQAAGTSAPTPSTGTRSTTGGTSGATNTGEIPTLEPRALIVADPRTNSLIVSAGPRDVAEIAALIQRIDTPGAAAELKVFTVANGDAATLTEMLRSLFSVPAPSGGGGGGGTQNEGGGISQGGPVRMQFTNDPRTNSIIAVGSREDLVVVESILLRLDQGDLRERKTTVYRLNNAAAQYVAQALNQWLQTQRQAEAQPELALSPFEQIEREVIIVP